MLLWIKVSKMNSKKKKIKTDQAQIISLGGMIGGYVGLCGIQVKAAVGFNMWPCCPVTEHSVWWKHSRAGQCFALYIELSHPCLSRAGEKGHLNTLVHADKRLEIQWPSLPPSHLHQLTGRLFTQTSARPAGLRLHAIGHIPDMFFLSNVPTLTVAFYMETWSWGWI